MKWCLGIIKNIMGKYMDKNLKEIVLYIFFGVLTTLINIISYKIFTMARMNYIISNLISFIISVLFAYITNKIYVFKSPSFEIKKLIIESLNFFTFRITTFIIDMLLMILLVEYFKLDDFFSKIIVNIIVIILNFVFSKFYIFKKTTI